MDIIETCKKEIIDFVSLPANLTDKTQPLEVAYFGPLMVVPEAFPPIVPAYHLGTAPPTPVVTVSQDKPGPSTQVPPSLSLATHFGRPASTLKHQSSFQHQPSLNPPATAHKLSPMAEWWDSTAKPAIYPFPAALPPHRLFTISNYRQSG